MYACNCSFVYETLRETLSQDSGFCFFTVKRAGAATRMTSAVDRPGTPVALPYTAIPQQGERLLYCDHVDGEGLFQLTCENDPEGIVAKLKSGFISAGAAVQLDQDSEPFIQPVGRAGGIVRKGNGAAIRIFGVGMGASGRVPLLLLEFRFSQRCR
jgi:hypothetical protein